MKIKRHPWTYSFIGLSTVGGVALGAWGVQHGAVAAALSGLAAGVLGMAAGALGLFLDER